VHNYIKYLDDFYEDFEVQPNCLQTFYPKQIQKHIQKRKHQNTERIMTGIRGPSFGPVDSSLKPKSPGSKQVERMKTQKALKKVKLLTKFQATLMQAVL
jgi:hypothetical protein